MSAPPSQCSYNLYFYSSGPSGLVCHAHSGIFWPCDKCSEILTSESKSKQSRSLGNGAMMIIMLFRFYIPDLSSMEVTLSHCSSCFLEPCTSLFSGYFFVTLPKQYIVLFSKALYLVFWPSVIACWYRFILTFLALSWSCSFYKY